jgi:MFS family permease
MTASNARPLARIPRGIWALGLVSLFMDVSSEMIHALLPVYLVSVLGASTLAVGVIEGIAESTASLTKIGSGVLSDWLGRRKLLAVIGYGLAALTKPVFPLAPSLGWVVAARFVDRVGKGIRGAPRDALIADIAPPDLRGASFGLRQTLDTVGAFVGPLVAILLMAVSGGSFTLVFWVAVVPAFVSLSIIVVAVEEPPHRDATGRPLSWRDAGRLGGAFWAVVGIGVVLTLARFSEAFLVLRANGVGLATALVPIVLIVMNVVFAACSYPAGVLADRIGRWPVLIAGIAVLIVADLVLASAGSVWVVLAGVALWGLHMGLTQGLFATLIADTAPPALRGTAFGLFNLATGIAMLVSSVLAGALWDALGPSATFMAGAGFTVLALAGTVLSHRRAPSAG